MPTNVGAADRWIRIALGLGLIGRVLEAAKTPWGLVGRPSPDGLYRFLLPGIRT